MAETAGNEVCVVLMRTDHFDRSREAHAHVEAETHDEAREAARIKVGWTSPTTTIDAVAYSSVENCKKTMGTPSRYRDDAFVPGGGW